MRISTYARRPGVVLAPIVLVLTIVALELSLSWSGTPDFLLPPPSSVFKKFVIGLMNGLILRNMLVTVSEASLGFFAALLIGTGLALAVNRSEVVSDIIQPYVMAFQAMPKVAIAPVIVLWFGFGIASKIVLVVLIAFFLIFINTLSGLKTLSNPMLELMRSYRATEVQILLKVKLPNALPFMFAGAESALFYSLTAAVVGEFVGGHEGLGYLIELWSQQLDTASTFAAILMLAIVALLMQLALISFKNRVLFWVAKS
jgi:NitT/TauT family transport system permease protein